MKHLAASTALAVVLSAPAMAQDQQQAADEAFLQGLEATDFLIGDMIGQDVYAYTEEIEAAAEAEREREDEQQMARQTIASDEFEDMESLGQVSEVVIDQQGQTRGLLLEADDREVAIDMQQVSFVFDQDDPEQIYVIAGITPEEIEQAPDFQRERVAEAPDEETEAVDAEPEETAAAEEDPEAVDEEPEAEETAAAEEDTETAEETGAVPQDADEQWRGDREAFTRPDVQREGMQAAEMGEFSVDDLIGANVYDTQDDNIGDVDDAVASQDGEIEFVVVDIGGFLGIGTHTVALGLDEITILHDDGWADIQVYVDATQDQLENLPEYAQN